MDLPLEIVLKILKRTDVHNFIRFAITCRIYSSLLNDYLIWSHFATHRTKSESMLMSYYLDGISDRAKLAFESKSLLFGLGLQDDVKEYLLKLIGMSMANII